MKQLEYWEDAERILRDVIFRDPTFNDLPIAMRETLIAGWDKARRRRNFWRFVRMITFGKV